MIRRPGRGAERHGVPIKAPWVKGKSPCDQVNSRPVFSRFFQEMRQEVERVTGGGK